MDFAVYVATTIPLLVLGVVLGIAKVWLSAMALFGGAFLCLFAVYLVIVQPRQRRDEVGMSSQVLALCCAVPLFAAGAALVYTMIALSNG